MPTMRAVIPRRGGCHSPSLSVTIGDTRAMHAWNRTAATRHGRPIVMMVGLTLGTQRGASSAPGHTNSRS
jgi:hypothetical protein